jgi:hypothetical protein
MARLASRISLTARKLTLHAFSDLGRAGVSGQGLPEELRGFFIGVVFDQPDAETIRVSPCP